MSETRASLAPRLSALRLPALDKADATYAALCVLVFGVLVGFYAIRPFGLENAVRDVWHHLAVLRELMADPFSPSNPHVPTDEPSRYFTPPNILAAMVARGLGGSAVAAYTGLSIAVIILVCVAVRDFARRFYGHAYAPHAALLCLLFAWGAQDGHAGYHTFASFTSSAGYPFEQAFALGIALWALVLRALTTPGRGLWHAAGVAVLTFVVVLSHQLSGVFALGGAGSFALFWGNASPRRRAAVVAALGAGAASTLLWPYFDPVAVTLAGTTDSNGSGWRSDITKTDAFGYQLLLTAPALLGLAGFRGAAGWRWFLILPFGFFAATWLSLVVLDHTVAHRVFPGAVMYGQLGLVFVGLHYAPRLWAAGPKRLIVAAGAAFLSAMMTIGFLPRLGEIAYVAGAGSLRAAVEEIKRTVPSDAIAFASDGAVFPYQSTGLRVVSIPRPEPAIPGLPPRQEATSRFFADGTPEAERRALIAAWDASHIAIREGDLYPGTQAEIEALGTVRRYGREMVIVTLGD